jgi:hypothetical protein
MTLRGAWLLGILAIVLGGCGTTQPPERRAHPVDQNLVLGDELRAFGGSNLYDALRSLRPRWFRPQGPRFDPREPEGPVVYLDGRRFGTLRALGLISVRTVVVARFYSPSEAQGRFGPGHLQGAIDVTSGPQPL